jgi:hypothetical protein
MDPDAGAYAPGDLAKMLMVREINDLAHSRHLGEQLEGFLRPEVVKGFHDVVRYERNRLMRLGELPVFRLSRKTSISAFMKCPLPSHVPSDHRRAAATRAHSLSVVTQSRHASGE